MEQKIAWLSQKSQLISDNIAKSDMPNATRTEIKPFEQLVNLSSSNPVLSVAKGTDPRSIQKTQDPIMREWEIMDLTETSNEYQALTALYKKNLNLIRQVTGRS